MVKVHVEFCYSEDGRLVAIRRNEHAENAIYHVASFGVDCPECDHYFNTRFIFHHLNVGVDPEVAVTRPDSTEAFETLLRILNQNDPEGVAAELNGAIAEDLVGPKAKERGIDVSSYDSDQTQDELNEVGETSLRFQCALCPRSYAAKHSLTRHLKAKHFQPLKTLPDGTDEDQQQFLATLHLIKGKREQSGQGRRTRSMQ